jgi:hypothetical protein
VAEVEARIEAHLDARVLADEAAIAVGLLVADHGTHGATTGWSRWPVGSTVGLLDQRTASRSVSTTGWTMSEREQPVHTGPRRVLGCGWHSMRSTLKFHRHNSGT